MHILPIKIINKIEGDFVKPFTYGFLVGFICGYLLGLVKVLLCPVYYNLHSTEVL